MLNLKNVPDNEICGLSTEELEFATDESASRFLIELSNDFLNSIAWTDQEDSVLSKEQEEELQRLELTSVSKSTAEQTNKWVNHFRRFLLEKKLCEDFERVPDSILNNYLRLYYASLRRGDGAYYAPASLICVRAAIHRHLVSAEINRKIDILNGENFRRANGVLKAMVKKYLESGQGKPSEFERITDEDLKAIHEHFAENKDDPESLQRECLFNILFYFQLRGRENLRALTKASIGFATGQGNREFAFIRVNLMQKNVKASLKKKEYEDLKKAQMFAQGDDNEMCPLRRLKKYMELLPYETKMDTLFPKCLKASKLFSSQQVLGKDKLANLMAEMSELVPLRKRYTNHCLRVTGINLLHESGMTNAAIANITGHKNSNSVQRYIRSNAMNLSRANDVLAAACKERPKRKNNDMEVTDKMEFSQYMQVERSVNTEKCEKLIKLKGTFENCTFHF